MKITWYFPSQNTSHLGIMVTALSPVQAQAINGLQGQVETIYRGVFASVGESEDKAVGTVSRNFQVCDQDDDLNRLVFAFFGSNDILLTANTPIIGFSRVFGTKTGGAHVTCTSLAVRRPLDEETAFETAKAMFQVTQELGQALADAVRAPYEPTASEKPVVTLWRSQFATTQRVKDLFEASGYSTAKCERVELTKFLTESQSEDDALPEGIVVKAFNLHSDDLARIYSVWELAYGKGTHPSIEAWKTHYLQTPRLAPELSFVAWDGNTPVSGVFLEHIVEGEGGGDAEVPRLMLFASDTSENETTKSTQLEFADDYAETQTKIRATAKSAYVCAVGTLPAYRGKRLARVLLHKAFEKAQLAGLDKVFLSTNRDNVTAIKVYSAVGMKETKRMVSGTMTVAEI